MAGLSGINIMEDRTVRNIEEGFWKMTFSSFGAFPFLPLLALEGKNLLITLEVFDTYAQSFSLLIYPPPPLITLE